MSGRQAQDERDDVLAYLAARHAAYAAWAAKHPGQVDEARSMQRHLSVFVDDLRAGLHEGMAAAAGETP